MAKFDNEMFNFDIQTRRLMQRELDRYNARRSMITREDLNELGMEYDGELYEPKP